MRLAAGVVAVLDRTISARYGDSDQFQSAFFVSDPQRTFFVLNGNWTLQTFYHPFAETFVQQLNQGGIPGLYDRALQIDVDTAVSLPKLLLVTGNLEVSGQPPALRLEALHEVVGRIAFDVERPLGLELPSLAAICTDST